MTSRNGWYARAFAKLLALGDGEQRRTYGHRKRALFCSLEGTVLEIGPGTGINLDYLPEGVRWIGAEPNEHMHPYIYEKAQARHLDIKITTDVGANLSLADASVDAVVSTLVLCSVPDVEAVLREAQRVLKPGGRFFFIEHVVAPKGSLLRYVQHGIKPLWMLAADGCRPDRDTGRMLQEAGFADVTYDAFEVRSMPIVRPHLIGVACNGLD